MIKIIVVIIGLRSAMFIPVYWVVWKDKKSAAVFVFFAILTAIDCVIVKLCLQYLFGQN